MTQNPWMFKDGLNWFPWVSDKAVMSCVISAVLPVIICIYLCLCKLLLFHTVCLSILLSVVCFSIDFWGSHPFYSLRIMPVCTVKGLTWVVIHKNRSDLCEKQRLYSDINPFNNDKGNTEKLLVKQIASWMKCSYLEFVLARKSFSKFISCLVSEARTSIEEVFLFDRDKTLDAHLQFSCL